MQANKKQIKTKPKDTIIIVAEHYSQSGKTLKELLLNLMIKDARATRSEQAGYEGLPNKKQKSSRYMTKS